MRSSIWIVALAVAALFGWFLLRTPGGSPPSSSPGASPPTSSASTSPAPDESGGSSDPAPMVESVTPSSDLAPHADSPTDLDASPRSGATLRVVVNATVRATIDHLEVHVKQGGGHRLSLDEHGVGEVTGLDAGQRDIAVVGGAFPPLATSVELVTDEVTEVQYSPSDERATTVEVRGWDGRRVEGARVFRGLRTFYPIGSPIGVTDANGRLEVLGLDDPGVALRVEAAGYGPTLFLDLDPLYQGELLLLELGPAATVLVRVRESTGDPVAGVVVTLEQIDLHDPFAVWPKRTTDERGEASFNDVPAGILRAYFVEGDLHHPTIEFTTHANHEALVEHELIVEHPISGVVRRNGAPVSGGTLVAGGRLHEVDASGEFNGVIPRGTTTPIYSSDGPDRTRVTFDERAVVTPVQWTLDYTGFDVEIVETYPHAATPPPRTIRLIACQGDQHASFDATDNAPTIFGGLPPGEYLLRVQYRKPVAAYAPELKITVDRDLRIDYVHQVVTQSVAATDIAPTAKVSMIAADGSTTEISVLRRDPLRIAWPVDTPGRGVIKGGDRAPVFFAVDEHGRLKPTPWDWSVGGVVDFWNFERAEMLAAKLVPLDETYGPREFWEQERFSVWNEARVRAGRYRVTVFDGDRVLATREIDVVEGETTKVAP